MKPEERFSDRVENYAKHRPGYPESIYSFLLAEGFISKESVIADIGCGTGLSSKLFLEKGHSVIGVEPNEPMRRAAGDFLKAFKNFIPRNGSAEHTGLEDHSVDVVLCAQSFHWFDRTEARAEFRRILKRPGKVILLWNERRTEGSDFLKVYEDFLIMFAKDYTKVDHRRSQEPALIRDFFGGDYLEAAFENVQRLDLQGLKGRVLSASYMPNEGDPDYAFMMYCLNKVFNRYEENGTVSLIYDSRIYAGELCTK